MLAYVYLFGMGVASFLVLFSCFCFFVFFSPTGKCLSCLSRMKLLKNYRWLLATDMVMNDRYDWNKYCLLVPQLNSL